MHRKIILLIVFVSIIPYVVMAKGNEERQKQRRAKRNTVIGVLIDSPHSKQNRIIKEQVQRYADEDKSINTEILDISENDISRDTAIDVLLEKNISVLLVYEKDTSRHQSLIDKATQRMLPVVFFYYAPPLDKVANNMAVVSVSYQEIGQMQAKFLLDILNENNIASGNIGLLTGNVGEMMQIEITQGFSDYVMRHSNSTINITQTQSAQWKESNAISIAETWLQDDDLVAIVSNNDAMILGASIPIREQEINDIVLIGAEGIDDAISAVKKSYIQATVYIDTTQMLLTALETAKNTARGDEVKKITYVPLTLITSKNAHQFGDK